MHVLHNVNDIDVNTPFTFTENSQIRGNYLRLNKPGANMSIKLHSFAMKNIPVCNSLTSKIVNSKTVVEFKLNLDKLWRDQRSNQTIIYKWNF